jgi:ATP-dependent protease HslVU (ClpYQ) peptidase subunit
VTTIATDGYSIAADGRTTMSGIILSENENKLVSMSDGSVIGYAGARSTALHAISEIEDAELHRREPDAVEGDYTLLRLYPSGAVALMDDGVGLRHPLWVTPPFAIGSGSVAATAAMVARASPKKAVRIAMGVDSNSGGVINVRKPRP